tara:strand:- start:81 stop:914 length:834 start_codon:yes stop_codon:yes gene_type:complete
MPLTKVRGSGIGDSTTALDVKSLGVDFTSDSYQIVKIQTDNNDDGSNDDAILQFTNGSSKTVKGEIRFDESENMLEIGTGDNQGHLRINSSGNVGIGTATPRDKTEVNGTIVSGTTSKPQFATYYGSNGAMNHFVHSFFINKIAGAGTAETRDIVQITGLPNFHQAMYEVTYGARLQAIADAVTYPVYRLLGVNRFNSGSVGATTNDVNMNSNVLSNVPISVYTPSNTEYRLRASWASACGTASFIAGQIRGWAVGPATGFDNITFFQGTNGNVDGE